MNARDPAGRPLLFAHEDQVAVLRVRGAEAADLLHRLSAQDLRPLSEAGQARLALFVDQQGRLVQRPVVLRLPAALLLILPPGQAAPFAQYLEGYTIMEDVTYEVLTEACPRLQLFVATAAGQDLRQFRQVTEPPFDPEVGQDQLAFAVPRALGRGVCLLPYAEVARGDFAKDAQGHAAFTATWLPKAAAWAQGQQATLFGCQDLAPAPLWLDAAAFRRVRCLAGLPAFGEEVAAAAPVLELRLDLDALSWNKGCYVGQEVLSRLSSFNKVARLLMGLDVAWPGQTPIPSAEALRAAPIKVLGPDGPLGRVLSLAGAGDAAGAAGLALIKQTAAAAAATQEAAGAGGLPVWLQLPAESGDAALSPHKVAARLRMRPAWDAATKPWPSQQGPC